MNNKKSDKERECIDSDIMDKILNEVKNFDYNSYTEMDVKKALNTEILSIDDFAALISPIAIDFLEEMAKRSQKETIKHFGNSIAIFTPLYVSNYCENNCLYCGFNCKNKINRGKLTLDEVLKELKTISETGLKDILILTGESKVKSDLEYIGEVVKLAREYFPLIGIEIYPLNTKEYEYLHKCGADYVCVYQETYDKNSYSKFHLSGPKTDYDYRFNSQERAIAAGMRKVAFGSLLGLSDFRRDAFATGLHGYFLQRKYPKAEISFSFLRLRPFIHQNIKYNSTVSEKELLQLILAQRIFTPFADITISTRESSKFRNGVVHIGGTKISAGVSVGVGGHNDDKKGDEQFEILDKRSVDEIKTFLRSEGLQPVFIDHIFL